MSKSLILTLGHNASAIAVQDGVILGGYEEERFSKIKSDSTFPIQSIQRLCHYFGQSYDDVCVGHWFTNGLLTNNKYFNMDILNQLGNGNIHSIQTGLTHHDSHLLSAQVFAKRYDFPSEYTAIVADGFGTFGECITIYKCDSFGHRIAHRCFGYGKSLGMLYQYATAYLEMKMHNHEYKMLGYEAHIAEVLNPSQIVMLVDKIHDDARTWIKSICEGEIEKDTDPIVNKAALAATQHDITNQLDGVLETLEMTGASLYDRRVTIAYYVQGIVEVVMASIVKLESPKNLLVVGGLFYNVKLNHVLADMVDKFCVMPLAGDQGAGLGVYQGVHGDLAWPGHLAWGHRDLSNIEGDGIITVSSELDAYDIMAECLIRDKMVNIIRGSMEFGPRSLCNTATIALPEMSVIETINKINDRTTVMPMAPAMTDMQVSDYLIGTDRIVGSLDYMIVTRDVRNELADKMLGASHKYNLTGRSTCRPQVIRNDLLMTPLLNDFGPLINTSFNYHGVPIAFDKETIEYSHNMQRQGFNITTVVIK